MALFWKSSKKEVPLTLGEQFKMARHAKALSMMDAAKAARLKESELIALEADDISDNHKLGGVSDPGYGHLIAVRYARSLGLSLPKIRPCLPPQASLKVPGRNFLKNFSRLRPKQRTTFMLQKPEIYSFSLVVHSLVKVLVVLLSIIFLLYGWSILRHLIRVIR